MDNRNANSAVVFHINGEKHSVAAGSTTVGARTALVDYIRDVANLKGTKVMCREGGCGACIVSAKVVDPITGVEVIKSVNSCLTPVLSCDGWDISTVESLGNKQEGYHLIQNRLVNLHGTQCGFCTPGMVMNMYSMSASGKELKSEDIEKNLDGNICRCTGYRPILDAFKSLTTDASEELKQKCVDIEDCGKCPLRRKTHGQQSKVSRARASQEQSLTFPNGEEWVTAKNLQSALSTAEQCQRDGQSYRFVAGNTSTGIFKNEGPYRVFIDVNGIPELKSRSVDNGTGISLGAATTLSDALAFLKESANFTGFEYGERVATHLERVANLSVRNVWKTGHLNGTIGGNLMIKHAHKEFPSDIFTILEAIGATLTLAATSTIAMSVVTLTEFLKTDMTAKLIVSVNLPNREGYHFRSFKITRRYQNAHAYVNAAFLLKVKKGSDEYRVEEQPRIVFGGIAPSFVHATAAEAALTGCSLSNQKTLETALQALEMEVKPETGPLHASPEYCVYLAKTLLYKTILEIIGNKAVHDRNRSGNSDLFRRNFTSSQTLERNLHDENGSLYKSVPKYEGTIQASGEAEYTADIPVRPDELFGAFVLSTVANANIKYLDAFQALKIPGVVRFVTAQDIPGTNNAMNTGFFPTKSALPVFASDKVSYYGQSVGLILATSQAAASQGAKLVKVDYDNISEPVVDICDAIAKARADGSLATQTTGTLTTKGDQPQVIEHGLKGKLKFSSQYHFYMETVSCVCHPREDGVDIYSSTQWMDHLQNEVALVLNLPTNSINVQVRRLGGGFGGKVTAPSVIAAACAVGCWVTNRAVRIVLDLETNMNILGKRLPYEISYDVGFDSNGRIGKFNADLIADCGFAANEDTTFLAAAHFQNAYKSVGWTVNPHYVTTNTPMNTYCRAPGTLQSVAAMEWVMEHIANYLNKDPIAVREANLLEHGDELLIGHTFEGPNMIPEMLAQMKREAELERRQTKIKDFNKANRWKKRGLAVVPNRYPIEFYDMGYPATVAVYHMDGHLAVSTGGIEMGQGLNTKIIQTVAQALQIPMNRIKVKPSNNFVGVNSPCSGASVTSDLACYSVNRACEQLRENLKPILEKLENPSWDKLIEEAYKAKVKLSATHIPSPTDGVKNYDVWVLVATEVEIDVLTGEYRIVRTDLYEDTGKTLSPGIDLGQIEGAYIFGQGFWTSERIIHDPKTGKLHTNGTWDYKPPAVKDIPEDFRVTLLSNAPNPHGVLRSKATGEPATDSAFAVVLALRNAIASARAEAGNMEWFEMSNAVTPEDVARLCLTNSSHFTL